MEYDCEIAAVIGKPGKDIPRERALDHVFGYTIYNDMTARDWQLAEMEGRWGLPKGRTLTPGTFLALGSSRQTRSIHTGSRWSRA
jgi:2-keto-4-pentenoate hydratase/2-oxohepta-3-ene-1,7-dioic acid hydratase in catechol pathway